MIEISALSIYPVKSFAGTDLSSLQLDRFGAAGDRRWMVVDGDGRFVSQRELPAMALFGVQHSDNGLILRHGEDSLAIGLPGPDSRSLSVQVWDDTVSALDAGDRAATWIAERLGQDCRLVYMPDDCRRLVDPDYAHNGETVGFADGFPLLLLAQASLDDLNTRLDAPVPMNRFRPNLVVSGCAAFAEDNWRRIRIAGLELELVKPCSRCVIPSIDQYTAQRDRAINRVLASYRRRDGKIYFGQNVVYSSHGQLQLGDPVEVLE